MFLAYVRMNLISITMNIWVFFCWGKTTCCLFTFCCFCYTTKICMFLRSSTPERLIQSDLIDFFFTLLLLTGISCKKKYFFPVGFARYSFVKNGCPLSARTKKVYTHWLSYLWYVLGFHLHWITLALKNSKHVVDHLWFTRGNVSR